MAKYRKRPVVIEAVNVKDLHGNRTMEIPAWVLKGLRDGVIFFVNGNTFVKTKEGELRCPDDNWIIQGVEGELYPCDPAIFEKTYDAVPEIR